MQFHQWRTWQLIALSWTVGGVCSGEAPITLRQLALATPLSSRCGSARASTPADCLSRALQTALHPSRLARQHSTDTSRLAITFTVEPSHTGGGLCTAVTLRAEAAVAEKVGYDALMFHTAEASYPQPGAARVLRWEARRMRKSRLRVSEARDKRAVNPLSLTHTQHEVGRIPKQSKSSWFTHIINLQGLNYIASVHTYCQIRDTATGTHTDSFCPPSHTCTNTKQLNLNFGQVEKLQGRTLIERKEKPDSFLLSLFPPVLSEMQHIEKKPLKL